MSPAFLEAACLIGWTLASIGMGMLVGLVMGALLTEARRG